MKTNNLDTLRILHIVKGILTMLFSFFPLIYVVIGSFMTSGVIPDSSTSGNSSPEEVGIIMIAIGSIFTIIILAIGILSLIAAKFIKEKRNYNFVFVASIICCLGGMLSIALGVFSLIELTKPEVKALFYGQVDTNSDDDIEVLNLKN